MASSENDSNIKVCAVNALNKHADSLKSVLSRSEPLFHCIADACKEARMIHFSQLEEIFDKKTGQTSRERVDHFIECIISVVAICPDHLKVFLRIVADKGNGNIAFGRVAEMIAQSCK